MSLEEKLEWLLEKCDGNLKVVYPIDVCGTPEWFVGVPAELIVGPEKVVRLPQRQAGFAMKTLLEAVDYAIREIKESGGA